MAMCSHSPEKAKGKCPSKKIAHEFSYKPRKRPKADAHGRY